MPDHAPSAGFCLRCLVKKILFAMFAMACCLLPQRVLAVLELEITGGVDTGYPIAISDFPDKTEKRIGSQMSQIIRNDLQFSGKFSPLKLSAMPQNPGAAEEITPSLWHDMNAVVAGTVAVAGGKVVLTYQLHDLTTGKNILNKNISFGAHQIREASHLVSNQIYEALMHERGAFLTKLAYVSVNPKLDFPYQLVISDYDGYNEKVILRSREPVMSPSWDPTGAKLAYVSFESKHPAIFIHDIRNRSRVVLSKFSGINGSPAFSPRGDKVAMVLSKDGNPEIYVADLNTKSLKRLTSNRVIDTEPAWSPDGNYVYFSSERGGKPQIYRVAVANPEDVARVTWENSMNLNPSVSPDGKFLALITRDDSGYHVAKQDMDTRFITVLSRNRYDESPSFAPNGSMIIYSTVVRGKKSLALVSSDGRFQANLPSNTGFVSAPAWSPFLN
ncbi:MAG: Tol-Pal system beta propeller repeat protein TolB [Succinivibrionaceae bacterium]|nr:Tol-Pal system beta propeller repeat protein TolB [Succinivibrionaceae bacterium]